MLDESDYKVNKTFNLNKLTINEQKEYYEKLRKECLSLKNNQFHFGQSIIKKSILG